MSESKLPITAKHINCPHFSLCSGCTINEYVDSPPIADEVRRYFSQKKIDVKIIVDEVVGWRYRAKLAVRGSHANPFVGLYREGSHEVVNIPFCKVHHPLINLGVEKLKSFITTQHIDPYNETLQTGLLRYVQFVVERSTGRLQTSLVINALNEEDPLVRQMFEKLRSLWNENKDGFWHSLWLNFNTRRDNVIFGTDWKLCEGEELIWENIAECQICFHPASFAQANINLFEKMLFSIRRHITSQTIVAEYYAGVGVIGLSLVPYCKSVHCLEVNPQAQNCFEKSRSKLNLKDQERIDWSLGRAGEQLQIMQDADVIIVDPPRKGLEVTFLKALKLPGKAKKLVYISCHWNSFQRDSEALLEAGWRLQSAEGYLFFPGTNHVETLAIYERRID